jgi:hypothetical protein
MTTDVNSNDGRTREFLAILTVIVSLLSVAILAYVAIRFSTGTKDPADTANRIMGTVLPLIGTWVGTVLAFYFSKENFEAATRSVTDLAKHISPQEKLQAVPVRDKMIQLTNMFYKTDPIDALTLVDVLKDLASKNKGDRIPVLTASHTAKYIIHRSMIDRYLAGQAGAGKDITKLTFADLFKDRPELQKLFSTSFATVKPDATLADANSAMQQTKDCEDVFVTADGTTQGEVVGWITDNIVQDNLH